MKTELSHIAEALYISHPVAAVMVLSVIFECIRPERPDTKERGLLLMALLLLPLTVVFTILYYLFMFGIGYGILPGLHLHKAVKTGILILGLAGVAAVAALTVRGIAHLLSLNKKNRIVTMILMLLLFVADVVEVYIDYQKI